MSRCLQWATLGEGHLSLQLLHSDRPENSLRAVYLSSHTQCDVELLPSACILSWQSPASHVLLITLRIAHHSACRPAHVAHITFREASSVQKVLALDGKVLPQASFPTDEVIGLERWVQEHGVMNNVTATHHAAARVSFISHLLLHTVGISSL